MSAREPRTFAVLGFATTHDALTSEQLLKDLGIDVTPIPAPKSLGGALCGIALRIEPSDLERALELLGRAGIEPSGQGTIEDV